MNDLYGSTYRETRWLTPYHILNAMGDFDLDPCGAPHHQTASEIFLLEDGQNGLELDWHGRVWMNPPYGTQAVPFLKKMAEHGNGIALIFARTDTQVFQDWVFPYASGFRFLKGRLNFMTEDLKTVDNANAPSVLVAYGEQNLDYLEFCKLPGYFLRNSNVDF